MAVTLTCTVERHISKPPAAREFADLFSVELELLPIEVLHRGIRNFAFFCSCDLNLDPNDPLNRIYSVVFSFYFFIGC